MNTIRELKQQEKYKSMLKRKNKEKKIYKDKNASLQLEKQRLYIALRNKDKEIERLNNIINGMEKFFQYAYDNEVRPLNDRKVSVWTICLDKLQELKGDESNE